MKATQILLAALCSLAAAIPQVQDDAAKKGKTLTYSVTSTQTKTVTVSAKSTVYTTTTYTRPYGYPAYHSIYNETLTDTYTSSFQAGTLIRPNKTTTVPTVHGFTNILEESPYTQPLSFVKKTVTVTSTLTHDPSPVTSPGNYIMVYPPPSTTITTTGPSYVVSTVSSTSTSTTSPAVYTKYEACGPKNLGKKIPTGQVMDIAGQYGEYDYDVTFTDNAEDCCAYCQGLEKCYAGTWETGPHVDFPGRCFVFHLRYSNATQVCDGSVSGGIFGHNHGSTNDGYTTFNGPCGNIHWLPTDADYFP